MSLLGPGIKPLLIIVSTILTIVAYSSEHVAAIKAERKIICPAIDCETTISDFICYQHEAATPVTEIKTFSCPFDQVCNLETDKYAWVTSKYQVEDYINFENLTPVQYDNKLMDYKKDSQIYKRYTEKSCEPIENFNQYLNNG
jgi:hypothetical protein